LYCSTTNGFQSATIDACCDEKPEDSEGFPDDFPSETDEDEYCVDWKGDGVSSDAVDSHHCGLFAIAEERSPDVIREAYDQSWTDDRELTAATDETEEYQSQQWITAVETRQEGRNKQRC